jgi:hypothetical protein
MRLSRTPEYEGKQGGSADNCEWHGLSIANYWEVNGAGTLMFGGKDPAAPDGSERTANLELCRLAIPRRVYTQSHMEYVLEIAKIVASQKDMLTGFQIVQQPQFLRHFSATLLPVDSQSNIVKAPAARAASMDGIAAV